MVQWLFERRQHGSSEFLRTLSTLLLTAVRKELCALVVLLASGWVSAATTVLTDCTNNCGMPTGADVAAACDGVGNCPANGAWGWNAPDYQRCQYTSKETPGTPGQYTYAGSVQVSRVSSCADPAGACVTNSTVTAKAVTTTETASVTTTANFSQGLQAGFNVALANLMSIEYSAEFGFGTAMSSTTSVTHQNSGKVGAPCCGKKDGWHAAFRQTSPATADVTLEAQVVCLKCGWFNCTPCAGNIWRTVKRCTVQVVLTKESKNSASKWTVCPVTCKAVHQNCCTSSTRDPVGGCKYFVW